jgi:hypothetical protein
VFESEEQAIVKVVPRGCCDASGVLAPDIAGLKLHIEAATSSTKWTRSGPILCSSESWRGVELLLKKMPTASFRKTNV